MTPPCPTVEAGLPGTAGSIKTREQDLNLHVCELYGSSGNRVTTRNGACYGRCTVSATTPNGSARSQWPPSCGPSPIPASSAQINRHRLCRGGHGQGDAAFDRQSPSPPPRSPLGVKQADRAKPRAHHSLRETRGGSPRVNPTGEAQTLGMTSLLGSSRVCYDGARVTAFSHRASPVGRFPTLEV